MIIYVASVELVLRVMFLTLCIITTGSLIFGLKRRYLRPRPLFFYMLGAFLFYTVVRGILVWASFIPDAQRDEVNVWLSPLAALGGFIVVLSVLLVVIWRIREGRLVSASANALVAGAADMMESKR